MTTLVRAIGRFCWDFVVGDDPRIALGVALVILAGGALERWTSVGDTPFAIGVGTALIGVAFGSLVVGQRRQGGPGTDRPAGDARRRRT